MKTIERAMAYNLPKLMGELVALMPPLEVGNEKQAVFTLEGVDGGVVLRVPDSADEQAIDAVLDAHEATPLPATPDPYEQLAASAATATTVDELRDAILAFVQKIKG